MAARNGPLSPGTAPSERGTAQLLLALETATAVIGVALLRGEEVVAQRVREGVPRHAEELLPMIDALLTPRGLAPDALDAFALAIGPGSFTSLRIGAATVKGLAFGTQGRVAAIPTLVAVAEAAAPEIDPAKPVAALLDARREEAYAAAWAAPAGASGAALMESGVYGLDALASELPVGCTLVGDGADHFGRALLARGRRDLVLAPGAGRSRRAAAVGVLGARQLARGEGVSAAELLPRYVRRAQAEVVRRGRPFEDAP